jgi:hypothetical protein
MRSLGFRGMAHRQEEKQRRREERLAAERAAERAAVRRRRLQILGGLVALLAVAGVAALLLAGGGEEAGGDAGDLAADARAAGCTYTAHRSEGRDHTDEDVRYRTNPPTSGPHNPVAAQDGVYAPGNEPNKENWVHSLEHGRVIFMYRQGTPPGDVNRLRRLAEEELNDSPGYHTLLFQNNTDMPAQFAVAAWTKSLTCDRLTADAEQVMRDFRERFTDKGPEFIP